MSQFDKVRGPLAFISDIHGNLPALEAVLDALKAAGVGAIYVAGDLVYRGDQPLEVWKRLQEVGARCVRGTTDLALAVVDPARLRPKDDAEKKSAERFRWTREVLGELILARLRRLPEAIRLELPDATEILVVHGSPVDPDVAITLDLDDDEVSTLIGTDPADIIVCGSSHVPFMRTLGDIEVIGVGSVGESPEGAIAHYTLIHSTPEGPEIHQHWVPYGPQGE